MDLASRNGHYVVLFSSGCTSGSWGKGLDRHLGDHGIPPRQGLVSGRDNGETIIENRTVGSA